MEFASGVTQREWATGTPNEYHRHRLCAMPWPKPDGIGYNSIHDPAQREKTDYIIGELWHQCASAKAAIIQFNRYITKFKIEECRVREIAYNADELKHLMEITWEANKGVKVQQELLEITDNRRRDAQIQSITGIAGRSELWVTGKEQELLVCRHTAKKEREQKRKEAGDSAMLIENILRSKSKNRPLYWEIVFHPRPEDSAKIIFIQAKTRDERKDILHRDYKINWSLKRIEFHKGKNSNDGTPKKPIIGIIVENTFKKHNGPSRRENGINTCMLPMEMEME